MRVLIVGCGYLGQVVGERLVHLGHQVFGLRRSGSASADLEARGIVPIAGDITRVEEVQKLPGPFDWVVNTVSSTKGGPDEYRSVYLEGTQNLLRALDLTGLQKYVYTSSTSVYAQTDGSVVVERSPTKPAAETSRILLNTEALLLETAHTRQFPAVILRASGIYGPARGHLFQQFLRGEAVIAGDGQRIINMIHRDDLAGVIIKALDSGRLGEVYNATDDEPVSQLEFFTWLAQKLGKPLPPVTSEPATSRKRGLTNKRVSNRKLKTELGYEFQYSTFREGYQTEMTRLGLARTDAPDAS